MRLAFSGLGVSLSSKIVDFGLRLVNGVELPALTVPKKAWAMPPKADVPKKFAGLKHLKNGCELLLRQVRQPSLLEHDGTNDANAELARRACSPDLQAFFTFIVSKNASLFSETSFKEKATYSGLASSFFSLFHWLAGTRRAQLIPLIQTSEFLFFWNFWLAIVGPGEDNQYHAGLDLASSMDERWKDHFAIEDNYAYRFALPDTLPNVKEDLVNEADKLLADERRSAVPSSKTTAGSSKSKSTKTKATKAKEPSEDPPPPIETTSTSTSSTFGTFEASLEHWGPLLASNSPSERALASIMASICVLAFPGPIDVLWAFHNFNQGIVRLPLSILGCFTHLVFEQITFVLSDLPTWVRECATQLRWPSYLQLMLTGNATDSIYLPTPPPALVEQFETAVTHFNALPDNVPFVLLPADPVSELTQNSEAFTAGFVDVEPPMLDKLRQLLRPQFVGLEQSVNLVKLSRTLSEMSRRVGKGKSREEPAPSKPSPPPVNPILPAPPPPPNTQEEIVETSTASPSILTQRPPVSSEDSPSSSQPEILELSSPAKKAPPTKSKSGNSQPKAGGSKDKQPDQSLRQSSTHIPSFDSLQSLTLNVALLKMYKSKPGSKPL